MSFIQFCVNFIRNSELHELFKWLVGFIFIDFLVKIISIVIEKRTNEWKWGDKELTKVIKNEIISSGFFITSLVVITVAMLIYGYLNGN